jgi:hypothetical protein
MIKDTATVAVDIPKPPPKLWEYGVYASMAFDGEFAAGLYAQRNFPLFEIRKAEVYAWTRGQVEKNFSNDEIDGQVSAGAGIKH